MINLVLLVYVKIISPSGISIIIQNDQKPADTFSSLSIIKQSDLPYFLF